jgi:hypothetical protein
MTIKFFEYQKKAITELRTGSILLGGVGSGKSITSLGYYYMVECGGVLFDEATTMKNPKDLYIITTARKRDSLDWEREAAYLGISKEREVSVNGVQLVVDSWNNIKKYKEVKDAFFIFDEQKVAGSGAWVRAFSKITRSNNWIILSATPGDTWIDYIPVFVANGFYANRTDFINQHVVFNTFANYPKIDRYVNVGKLERLKNKILVKMDYEKKTINHIEEIIFPYDKEKFELIYKKRWNPFKDLPIKGAAEACYAMRQVVNSHQSRFDKILELLKKHKKIIIFYNFDYELEILRRLNDLLSDVQVAEYNGHLHEAIPNGQSWIYLAQYLSASEAWNCVETNAIILYSRNYSYKQTIQAMGRIDRQNTPFLNLYYYFFTSDSPIDDGIRKAYSEKKNFNETKFMKNGFA